MPLQVWLPLNGSLKNQGARGDVTFTSVGSWTYESGKVTSSCMTIPYIPPQGTYDSNITADSKFKFTKNFSVSIWAKLPTDNGHINPYIATEGTYDTNVKKLGWFIRVKGTSIIISVSSSYHEYTELVSGNWYLITFTINDNYLCSIYINGIFKESFSLEQIPEYGENARLIIGFLGFSSAGSLMAWNGSVNDFRLYDHCLSVKEVKELAKGLMVHYTLSRPCDNLLVNSNFGNGVTNWTADGSTRSIVTELTYGNVLQVKATTANSGRVYNSVTGMFTSGETYTYSFLAKADSSVTVKPSRANVDNGTTVTLTTKWTRYSGTITATASSNTFSLYIGNTTSTIQFAYVKLEKGNKATPWIPNSADTLYSAMGLNSTTESDVTGYGNDGTRVNITTRESDTPRYLSCIYFNGTGTRINLPTIIFIGKSNSYTFSWWAKSGSSGMFWGFGDGNRLNLYMATNLYWNTGDGSNNPFYSSGTTVIPATTYGNNVWHHYAITGDGTTVTLYVDGNKAGTAKTYKGITGTQIYINGWDTGTSYKFNGRMSDFRIYATALSADDILELYHTSASIDKNGNMHCYELVEV